MDAAAYEQAADEVRHTDQRVGQENGELSEAFSIDVHCSVAEPLSYQRLPYLS